MSRIRNLHLLALAMNIGAIPMVKEDVVELAARGLTHLKPEPEPSPLRRLTKAEKKKLKKVRTRALLTAQQAELNRGST